MIDYPQLKTSLDTLYHRYRQDFITTDPLQFVYRYDDSQDREIVALLSSALAYGTVRQIFHSLERLLALIGPAPRRYVENFDSVREIPRLQEFRHRFTTGRDIACLLYFLQQVYRQHESLEDLFLEGYTTDRGPMADAMAAWVEKILSLDASPIYGAGSLPRNAGVRYLLCSPAHGSACKRLCLFLRWMVRRGDTVDLGLWPRVSPADLVYPLDTHIVTIAHYLGLTTRRTPNWAMTEEITAHLRRLDPDDPVRYDFALSRLGILDIVRRRNGTIECDEPLLEKLCASPVS